MGDPDRLLAETSRTFALSIPRLPEPVRAEVTLAYLLFRIADTFEDAAPWPRVKRLRALEDFAALLDHHDPARAKELVAAWLREPPCDHAGYLELLAETPDVLERTQRLDAPARAVVIGHALRTTHGMAGFVERSTENGSLRLHDLADLSRYCYVVAGIVGELLTDLFLLAAPSLAKVEHALRSRAVTFGEGLQLVNITKDADDDARDGRVYLPAGVPRREVLDLARRDLDEAERYVRALQSGAAPRGFVEFTALPVILARAALDAVESQGPGAKVPRSYVLASVMALDARLDAETDAFTGAAIATP
ncbi:MAG: squalene/phytoene synthase family protein [Polyangiales bacterium]